MGVEILKQSGATSEAEREQRRHLCKDGGRACVRQCEPRLLPPRWCLGRRNVKRRSLSELDAHVDFFTRAVSPIWLHSSFRGGFVVAYDDGKHYACRLRIDAFSLEKRVGVSECATNLTRRAEFGSSGGH